MKGATFDEIKISGVWVDWGVSEDCMMVVGWRFSDEDFEEPMPKVLKVEECYGIQSGTDYLDKLLVTPDLLDHLRDMICERYEV